MLTEKNPIGNRAPQSFHIIGIAGILLAIVVVIVKMTGVAEDFPQSDVALITLVVHILAAVWVKRVAAMKNRHGSDWWLGALFFPPVAMILIGFKRPAPEREIQIR